MITHLYFSNKQKNELLKIFNTVKTSPYTDYKEFKREVSNLVVSNLVPLFFSEACDQIKKERENAGINAHVLHNMPLDEVIPVFDHMDPVNDKYLKKKTFIGETLLELFSQLTNSPLLAYRTRNNGDFFHDVYAHKRYQNTQTQKTDGELFFHNDRTAHPVRADFLSLLGMRCCQKNHIYTGYIDGKSILEHLSVESQYWLRMPLYITPFDEYSKDSNQTQIDSEKHAILENIHTFRYYDTRTIYVHNAPIEAVKALVELKSAMTKAKKEHIAINTGDLFSFANQDSLHNREIIKINDPDNAEKRWLLKTYSFRDANEMNKYNSYFQDDLPGYVVSE
ncbi:TPA: taurine catabolism dioxygenase TauD [Providencia stuartii]|uniref:taurine catabolism dioxygenase TauD n=1 Tax=Providencia stuartii TaxID=588 RepID=UPI0011400233|nr:MULTISPECIES: taurine catabolism dioxygenase TauD [Providencia]MBN5561332.1 taurine catabolism dioxygenase TauD [Providencia stuartii]MBN5601098.1 taurine catabolism dioxygenase TauD [Providencia stuartii]MBN5605211.1 taurine catabolism dioxygenase TauD [Providencia stuartii]MCL8326006.1 taurine catabolism dioxygenase TauD [Providencia thailandensis]MDF4173388.1 taurine catabolism dioxygenase TauD [Providencia thailandensis]